MRELALKNYSNNLSPVLCKLKFWGFAQVQEEQEKIRNM